MVELTFRDIKTENKQRYIGINRHTNNIDYIYVRIRNRCILKLCNINDSLFGYNLLLIPDIDDKKISDIYNDKWHIGHQMNKAVININIKEDLNAKIQNKQIDAAVHYFYNNLKKKNTSLKLFNFTWRNVRGVNFSVTKFLLKTFYTKTRYGTKACTYYRLHYQIRLETDEIIYLDFEIEDANDAYDCRFEQIESCSKLISITHDQIRNQILINNMYINLLQIANEDLDVHKQFIKLFNQFLNQSDTV
jgi:hypothetical protein